MKALLLKAWAGPLTIGSFGVMAVTGILMFFHFNIGAIKLVHEWMGWVFVLGGSAHMAVNWTPLLAYFRRPRQVAIMAGILLVGAISLFPIAGRSQRPPFLKITRALEQSSLNLAAQVARRTPESVVDELRTHAIRVRDEAQTIAAIAEDNRVPATEILALVLGSVDESPRVRKGAR